MIQMQPLNTFHRIFHTSITDTQNPRSINDATPDISDFCNSILSSIKESKLTSKNIFL